MEHLLENLFSETTANLRGLIFGFVHVSIMLVGYYSAFSINRFLKIFLTVMLLAYLELHYLI